jgi:fumarate reductase subunit C
MPSQTVAYPRSSLHTAAYLDFLQMLTGVGLILFMFSHMILVSSIHFGAGAMNTLAKFLEDTYMAQIGGLLIGATFLLHFILAARKVPFRTQEQKILWQHSLRLHHLDTWLWVVQA